VHFIEDGPGEKKKPGGKKLKQPRKRHVYRYFLQKKVEVDRQCLTRKKQIDSGGGGSFTLPLARLSIKVGKEKRGAQ